MATRQRASKTSDLRAPNANDSKVSKAVSAMQGLGVSPEVVKPVLRRLLKLYGSWEHIEEDNYRALADDIFQSFEDKTKHKSGAEGSMPSNMNTATQKKKRQNREPAEDIKPTAKLIRPVVQHGHSNSHGPTTKSIHNIKDITRGTEKMKISLIDEVGIELPKFVYIPQNTPYQDAYVHFSLARIADDGCCKRCIGDCLSSRVPCACSRDTGGEFAYTPQGLLKDEFLGACISMNCEPQNHHLFECQDCPLERAKNVQNPEPCKGHLVRKFIKECWRKCGCTMECGNRVVQRGPTCKLQVFSTEGKGWGLRTLEYLPKGSFVCEYVGEILTNMELYERNKQSRKNERHTYPVYLDADWGSEQVLKDEDALCLDATNFGNVGRFINHRCFDSNLIEIPVEVETPDHHYYHIAFFTKRNVDAYEELTWDYGIDFEDEDHPIKAFECQCASSYCRDVRREAAAGTKEKELKMKRSASGNV
ncbi:histone-lysine N-methyltransferase SUVR4 [Cynara cardunculus var. scolymus]|uniref:histone-lysine N-methyltransferase SUVR4 n=1 Tax=Cynara cardunculus var. scolymus TaxID=59895 RepID=UPI000D629AD0|nr:histone-lysine N-methyltransferase SUVR4 [Cynara cardunculus var. scolymus]